VSNAKVSVFRQRKRSRVVRWHAAESPNRERQSRKKKKDAGHGCGQAYHRGPAIGINHKLKRGCGRGMRSAEADGAVVALSEDESQAESRKDDCSHHTYAGKSWMHPLF
jgi:hypothetical protein